MPRPFVLDYRANYASALLMSAGPKLKYQTTEQDITANGERKWEVMSVMTRHADPGQTPEVELIKITLTGGTNPAEQIVAGTPVEFDGFAVGFSSPERTERGVRGGKPWYQASGVRALNGARPKGDG